VSQVPLSPNRYVFNNRLNSLRLSRWRRQEGNEFHRCGPAVVKHRSPWVLCDRRTTHIAVSVEWSRCMLVSAMSWQSSDRYVGALPDRHWKTRTATLTWTRRAGHQAPVQLSQNRRYVITTRYDTIIKILPPKRLD